MSVFRIKNRAAQVHQAEVKKKQPKDLGLPVLPKPTKTNKVSTIIAMAGFLMSIAGLGLYINQSRSGQKDETKQYVLMLSIVDSAKQPIPGAILKSQQRVVGTTDAQGQWKKTFAIVAGSQYPLTVEGADNEGRVETKHVKVVFPHWTRTSSLMNRVIRLDTLKNKPPAASAALSASENSASVNSASVNSASVNSASVNSASVDSASVNSASVNSASVNSASVNSTSENSASGNRTSVAAPQVSQEPKTVSNRVESPSPQNHSENLRETIAAQPLGVPTKGPVREAQKAQDQESRAEGIAMPSGMQADLSDVKSAGQEKVALGAPKEILKEKESQGLPAKLTPLFPKDLASIWIQSEGSSPASSVTRGQSLASIKDKMQLRARSLGFTIDQKAGLILSLKNLDGKLGSEAQDVIQVDVRLGNVPMESYLRNYQEDALSTARLILWRARLSLPITYQIKRTGHGLAAMQPLEGPTLWRLSEGTNLSNDSGARGVAGQEVPKALSIGVTGAPSFCVSSSTCRAQLIPGEVSQQGWSKRRLTLLGSSGRNLKVFAAGNPAVETKGEFFYEGPDNGFTVFTVLEEGKIIYRNAIHNNLYQQTILTLPVASISRR